MENIFIYAHDTHWVNANAGVTSNFKIRISIADFAKDTSLKCFENVWMSTTLICNKK